jgi:hypothetical protein
MIDRKNNIRKTICLSVSLAKLYQTLIEDWGLLDVFTVES